MAAAIVCAASAQAQASLVEAQDLMHGFTTLTLGNHTANQETEGTVFVGGDYINGHNINPDGLPDVNVLGMYSGSFFVGGNAALTGNNTKLKNGAAFIGGTVTSGELLLNPASNLQIGTLPTTGVARHEGSGAGTITPGLSGLPIEQVRTILKDASLELSGMTPTGGTAYLSDQNDLRFVSEADANGLAVFDIASAAWMSGGTFKGVSAAEGVTTVINVGGEHVTIAMNANLSNPNVVFNFYEAATVNITSTFNYSVLAPLAAVDVGGSGMFATVVAGSLVQGSEIRPYDSGTNFNGNFAPPSPPPPAAVPLPGAAGLLALGLVGLGGAGALRRRAAA